MAVVLTAEQRELRSVVRDFFADRSVGGAPSASR